MTVDLLGEALSFFVRSHRMEAASIKHEAKWRSVNVAFQDVQHGESTRGIRFGRFVSGLLYRNLGNINPDNIEILLRQPDCVVAGSASYIQSLAGINRCGGHGLNQVKVRLADVPRGGTLSVMFVERVFGTHCKPSFKLRQSISRSATPAGS